MHKKPITAKGSEKIKAKLMQLKNVDRINVIKAIKQAREYGDLSENAEYSSAREQQGLIEAEIRKLESILASSTVISQPPQDLSTIRFGSFVVLENVSTKKKSEYHIVGAYESDIANKELSIESPLGQTLLGKKKGDCVSVVTPKGIHQYTVCSVKWKKDEYVSKKI